MNANYFETLADALRAHIEQVHDKGGVFVDDFCEMYTFISPVSYGQTIQDHRELETLKGKKTKQYAHASIYRSENGLYELTSYIS